MRALLLYCHPRTDSFIASLCRDVRAALTTNGHEVDYFDLYAHRFDPVLSADEMQHYAAAREHAAALKQAEALVALFPTWWYGPPALLKGYFDRLWAPGVAFELKDGDSYGLLRNIRRLVVITTYGAPRAFIEDEIGDPGAAFWKKGIARLLSEDCITTWLAFYGLDTADRKQLEAFRTQVRDSVNAL